MENSPKDVERIRREIRENIEINNKKLERLGIEPVFKVSTPEETRRVEQDIARRSYKRDRRNDIVESILDVFKNIFFPPLRIMFNIISFCAHILGFIACLACLWGIYKVVTSEVDSEIYLMIASPFIAFGISYFTRCIASFFDNY